ncbi:MAG: hypothetical protein N4A71_04370 [Carboxylicivirga sp.]|jgi:hypothetical protein|nr:hypothetical protein [Carboxylicivirga sp.]MCT4644086.1 hypothetical protein [Carboxylicivirga sp.]
MKKFFAILAFTFAYVLTVQAAEKDIIGNWKFESEQAPYDYQTGKAVFYEKDNAIMLKLEFEYEELKDIKVTYKDNKYTFEVEVDYQMIPVTLEIKNGVIEGYAETPEGNLPVTMKKAK